MRCIDKYNPHSLASIRMCLGLLPVLTQILEIAWDIYTTELRNFASFIEQYMLAVTIEYTQWLEQYLLACGTVLANSAKLKRICASS
jgi:hypothetical protein